MRVAPSGLKSVEISGPPTLRVNEWRGRANKPLDCAALHFLRARPTLNYVLRRPTLASPSSGGRASTILY